jgi:hypothetical protein
LKKSRRLVKTIRRKGESPLQAQKRRQRFICADNETLSIAVMCIGNEDRSPLTIRGDTQPNCRLSLSRFSSSRSIRGRFRPVDAKRLKVRGRHHPKEGGSANSYVALQNPTVAQWQRNGRVTILEYEKVKIT